MGVKSESKTINLINSRKHLFAKQTGGTTKRRRTRHVSLCWEARCDNEAWHDHRCEGLKKKKKNKLQQASQPLEYINFPTMNFCGLNREMSFTVLSDFFLFFFQKNLCFREVKRNKYLWHASAQGSIFLYLFFNTHNTLTQMQCAKGKGVEILGCLSPNSNRHRGKAKECLCNIKTLQNRSSSAIKLNAWMNGWIDKEVYIWCTYACR